MRKESAFSGLEAAIVLIAFVVVAAVFAYVMLGAGFFATQKSQEVTYSGIKQATSNIVVDGTLYGSVSSSKLTKVTMTLSVPEGAQSQKIDQVEFVVTVDGVLTSPWVGANGLAYSVTGTESWGTDVTNIPTTARNGVVQAGEKVDVRIGFAGPSTATGGSFTLEVKPPIGASSLLTKSINAGWSTGPII